jgi:hypothetical protein
MDPRKIHFILLIIPIILLVLGVKTLIPNSKASKPCLLGYKAACSFTPISTLILLGMAIIIFIFTRKG